MLSIEDKKAKGAFNSVPLLLVVLVVLLGCIPFVAALSLYALHTRAELHEAEVNASKTAALVLRSFEQSIEPIDSLLLNFASAYNPDWTPEETYLVLKGFNLPASIIQLTVVDKNGIMVASSLSPPNDKKLDLSDREHIRVHMDRNTADGELFISKPVLGRVSKTWTIQLTRPLDDGSGHFGGVVVASYLIADFINFYRQLRVEDQMLIALIGRDGVVRARAAAETSFGDDLSKNEAFKAAIGRQETIYDFKSPLDGVERVGAIIQSQRYPILVAVAYSLPFIRGQTEDFRAAIWGTALGLFLALLLVALIGSRYVNLQKRLNARELQAIARQREARVLDAISRVPGISVMHVTEDGPSLVGSPSAGPFSTLVTKYLHSGRFRALSAGLKEPIVSNEHLSDGASEAEVEVVVAPLGGIEPEAGRRSSEVVVFAVDQTTRRLEENKLYQMSKLASLGEVATGLAHEINQPLGVIRLAASNALAGMKKGLPPEHLAGKLDRIIQQTVRMSRIIDHMRIFGRKSDDRLEPCRPMEAVEGALQVVGAHFRLDNMEVSVASDPGVPDVLCRQDQLEQVLINLLQNARDAVVERRRDEGSEMEGRIAIQVGTESGDAGLPIVRIDVADNAGGIPPEIVERVFQPFFTTKPPGKGTGLGLSVSFGIVRDHGGSLSVANGPEGAIFTVRLPARRAAPTETVPAETASTEAMPGEVRAKAS